MKKAHFVPVSYLRGFTHDDKNKMTYAYSPKAGVFTTSIRDICTKKYIYRLEEAEDGNLDYIEDTLANKIEPKYLQWLKTIEEKRALDNPAIADLSIFITLQHLRVPGSLKFLHDQQVAAWKGYAKEQLKELYKDAERDSLWKAFQREQPEHYEQVIAQYPEWKNGLPKEIIEKMVNEEGITLKIDPRKNNVLVSMIDLIMPTADQFLRRTWNFLFAPDGTEFITSDMPAFVAIPTGKGVIHFTQGGFGRTDAVIFFPLSKNVCVVIGGTEYVQNFYLATDEKVDEINRIVATRPVLTFLISSSKELVEKYSKYRMA